MSSYNNQYIVNILLCCISSLLLLSAIMKLLYINDTIDAVTSYIYIGNHIIAIAAVLLIVIIELYIGFIIIASLFSDIPTYYYMLLLLLLFSSYIAASIIRILLLHRSTCGCFGAINIMSSPGLSLLRDMLILIATLYVINKKSTIRLLISFKLSAIFINISMISILVINGYFNNITLILNWNELMHPRMYGMANTRREMSLLYSTAATYFKNMDSVVETSIPQINKVYDGEEILLGWMASTNVPDPIGQRGNINILLIYTNEIVDIIIRTDNTSSKYKYSLEKYKGTSGCIILDKETSTLEGILVTIVNNMIYNIYLLCEEASVMS